MYNLERQPVQSYIFIHHRRMCSKLQYPHGIERYLDRQHSGFGELEQYNSELICARIQIVILRHLDGFEFHLDID